jgi:hypothetical protein
MKAKIYLSVALGAASALLILLSMLGCKPKPPEETAAEVRGAPMRQASPNPTGAVANGQTSAVAALTTPKSPAPNTNSAPSSVEGRYKEVGFSILSAYEIEVSDEMMGASTNSTPTPKVDSLIPEKVRALNKQTISLQGFMLPLKVQAGQVTEMLIMKDQSMCCYGTVPRLNEWVSVKMTGEGVKPIMDQPVTVFGTLHVGEMRENGYLVGIYSLDGEKMTGPSD